MAETLGVACTLRAHTTRPISDCCMTIPWTTQNLAIDGV